MTLKIFGVLAILGAISVPAFAEDNMGPGEDAFRPRPPMGHIVTCIARNVTGRTFFARGDWRVNRSFLERRALDECRRESLPLIGFTCRDAGCR